MSLHAYTSAYLHLENALQKCNISFYTVLKFMFHGF